MAQVPPEPVDSSIGTNGAQSGSSHYVSDDDYGKSIYARNLSEEPDQVFHQGGFQQAGFPQNAAPWPGNNLYGPDFSQHYVKDGLWHRITDNRGRRYFFGLEALITRSSKPGVAVIGNTQFTDTNPLVDDTFFPVQHTEYLGIFKSLGMRGRIGFFNPDQSGVEATMFWINEATDTYSSPLNNDGDITDVAPLRPIMGLPIDDNAGGTVILYDKEFHTDASSSALGANLHFLMSPKWKYNNLRVRPLWGLRYMRINETWGFSAVDSGLFGVIYTEFPDGSGNYLDTTEIDTGAIQAGPPDFTTYLNSRTRTNLAGPEIGLQYDLGGNTFKLSGKTTIGIMANNEDINMEGNNFLDQFAGGLPTTPTPTNPNPHYFTDSQNHNHVSPLFEQSIFGELKIFHVVPYLRKMRKLDNAVLRIGYTYTLAGQIVRPAESVTYAAADPNFIDLNRTPKIRTSRTSWFTSNWSFAIDWRY